jgi:hypothetical protein
MLAPSARTHADRRPGVLEHEGCAAGARFSDQPVTASLDLRPCWDFISGTVLDRPDLVVSFTQPTVSTRCSVLSTRISLPRRLTPFTRSPTISLARRPVPAANRTNSPYGGCSSRTLATARLAAAKEHGSGVVLALSGGQFGSLARISRSDGSGFEYRCPTL